MLATRTSIGKLDRRIILLEQQTHTGNNYGTDNNGFVAMSSVPEVWASVKNKSGSEVIENNQVIHASYPQVIIRYRSDLTINHRFIHNNMVYGIKSVNEFQDQRKRWTEIIGEYIGVYGFNYNFPIILS